MGRSLLSDFILPVEEKYADQIDLRFYRRRVDGIRHSRAKYRSGISLPLFTRSQVCQPDGGVGLALPVQWESAVGGQHRERVWLHAAISGLGKIISALPFAVLGFPANDFGGQEPGSNKQIAQFCQLNYGVTF